MCARLFVSRAYSRWIQNIGRDIYFIGGYLAMLLALLFVLCLSFTPVDGADIPWNLFPLTGGLRGSPFSLLNNPLNKSNFCCWRLARCLFVAEVCPIMYDARCFSSLNFINYVSPNNAKILFHFFSDRLQRKSSFV